MENNSSHVYSNDGFSKKDEGNPYEGSSYESFETPEDIESDFLNNALGNVPDEENSEETINNSFEQDLKKSLPSAELRKIHALAKSGTLKQVKLKPRESIDDFDGHHEPQPSSSAVSVDVDMNMFNEEEYLQVNPSEIDNIRDMTTTMDRKKSVRSKMKDRDDQRLSGWQNFKFERAMRWQKWKMSIKDAFSSMQIWKGHLKQVEGLFGTGVLSYFTFLRWLLYINLMVCVLTVSFLFVPQIIHQQSTKTNNETFNGLELLTGEGWFANTELFYGAYTNEKVKDSYDMKYAYLFVGGGYMVLCIMVLAVSIANSYKENFIVSDGTISTFSSKVFCSWDYGMSNKETAKIKMKSIAQDILETLGSERSQVDVSCCSRFVIFMLRVFTNLIVVALMAGSSFLIYYVSEMSVEESFADLHNHHLVKAMLPAIIISLINLIIPSGFRLIASIECYHFPQTELLINLIRTIVLKLASLLVYIVTLYIELNNIGTRLQVSCWENFYGQAFYKLVIVDFLAVMLSTFFEEFIRKLLSKHLECCRMHAPGFDISKNVLNLIYSQGICWLGTFYCPLLPLINILKLIITFYVKKTSVVRNCRPSLRPFKASKMLVWFLCLLSLMLILTLIVVGYIIMDEKTLKPSVVCGPFRGETSIYSLVLKVIDELPDTLRNIVNVISSLSVIAAIIFLIGLLAYYFRMRKVSSEKKIKLLKQQLALAGQDKQFLIAKLRQMMKTDPHVN